LWKNQAKRAGDLRDANEAHEQSRQRLLHRGRMTRATIDIRQPGQHSPWLTGVDLPVNRSTRR